MGAHSREEALLSYSAHGAGVAPTGPCPAPQDGLMHTSDLSPFVPRSGWLRVAGAVLAGMAASCGGGGDSEGLAPGTVLAVADPAAAPHIVLVLIDTLRADHTSLHGYTRETTPQLERIAARGTVFDRHYANAAWTKPSVASILTGLLPSAHGSRVGQFMTPSQDYQSYVETLHPKVTTFPEVLKSAGYRTCAYTSNYNMLAKWGYSQGFDSYEVVDRADDDIVLASDRASIDFALAALDTATQPTFVWSHLMTVHQYVAPLQHKIFQPESHTPIDPEALEAKRVLSHKSVEAAVAAYDASIRYCDELVGELADAIAAKHPNTLLIITADHGEEFGEHGGFEHGWTLYNEILRVPCVMIGPGVPAGTRVSGITDSLDVFPTILANAGVDPRPFGRLGQTLAVGGLVTSGKEETLAEQHHRGPYARFSLTRPDIKLIESHGKLLTDGVYTGETSGVTLREVFRESWEIERENVLRATSPAVVAKASNRIDRYRHLSRKDFETQIGERIMGEVNAKDLRALEALGYGGDGK